MYEEEELLPISAVQHLAFCERQCALIYIEGIWEDNPLTIEGSHLHERTHNAGRRSEIRGDLRISRDLALRSFRLGLSGRADVVEFHRVSQGGIPLPGSDGLWLPFPIEYKRGRPKKERCDEIQLCAHAICLEEMLGVAVPEGALYYGAMRRRFGVSFDERLRAETTAVAERLHRLMARVETPVAIREPKCRRCSLVEVCMPGGPTGVRSAERYLRAAIRRSLADSESERE